MKFLTSFIFFNVATNFQTSHIRKKNMEDPLHEQFTYFEMSKMLLWLIYNPVYDAVVILKRKNPTVFPATQ